MKTQDKITDAALIEAGFNDDTEQNHVRALCTFLDCEPSDLENKDFQHCGNLAVYGYGSREYAIGTDEEATEAAKNYIADSAWAFNASFLASYCQMPEEMFTAVQEKCEGANDAVVQCIERGGGMDDFCEQAISADGRGHFMSSYDGEENEVTVEATEESHADHQTFYIYRIN